MPQKTFNNLPPERQKEIVNVGLEEFAGNDFESASLTDIINRLGIAKGSFYRYFESKEALYNYLLGFCRELFTLNTVRMLNSPSKEFASLWQDMFLSFKRREEEYPMIIRFWLRVAKNRPYSHEESSDALRRKLEMLRENLSSRRETDSLREESADLEYVSMVILYHQLALVDYICFKYRIPPDKPIFSLSEEQLKSEVSRFADILLNGIRKG